MRVHLHTLTWNDGPMVEFFFRHYAPWVDRFYVLDDHSSDGTREHLHGRPDVVLGDAWTQDRHAALAERLGPTDRSKGWGHKRHWSRRALDADFEAVRVRAVNVAESDHDREHREPRWWRAGRPRGACAGAPGRSADAPPS